MRGLPAIEPAITRDRSDLPQVSNYQRGARAHRAAVPTAPGKQSMSEPEQRSRPAHSRPITVEISRFWPPEVALAVFEWDCLKIGGMGARRVFLASVV